MRSIIILMFAACALGTAHADTTAEIKGKQLTLSVDAREQANLIYQLDCMTQLGHCAPDVFENLWHNELQFNEQDQQRLSEWKTLRQAIAEGRTHEDPTLPIEASFPLLSSDEDTVWNRVRWAGFTAGDRAALDAAWAKQMTPQQVAASEAILNHFQPRFHRWWVENEATATAFGPALRGSLEKARGYELIAAAARFYGSDLGDGHLQVHLFVLPKGERKLTRAQQVGSHLTVEIVPGESADNRVDVVVHELAHRVFGLMPPQRKASFIEGIMAAGEGAVPAWNLFDEVQATVIGNILAGRNASDPVRFQKLWDTPRSFYSNESIDLGARASYALFEKAFAAGGAMPADFPAAYVAAMRTGLGEKLSTPATYLDSMAIITFDPRDKERQTTLRVALHASSVWGFDAAADRADFAALAKRFRALSTVAFVRADQIASLDGLDDALGITTRRVKEGLGSSAGAIVIAKRSSAAYAFILIARDDAAMDALVASVAACPLTPGVCKRV